MYSFNILINIVEIIDDDKFKWTHKLSGKDYRVVMLAILYCKRYALCNVYSISIQTYSNISHQYLLCTYAGGLTLIYYFWEWNCNYLIVAELKWTNKKNKEGPHAVVVGYFTPEPTNGTNIGVSAGQGTIELFYLFETIWIKSTWGMNFLSKKRF